MPPTAKAVVAARLWSAEPTRYVPSFCKLVLISKYLCQLIKLHFNPFCVILIITIVNPTIEPVNKKRKWRTTRLNRLAAQNEGSASRSLVYVARGHRIYVTEEVIIMMVDTIEDLLTTSASEWSDESATSSPTSVQMLSVDS